MDDVTRPASTRAASGPAVPPHPAGGPQPAFCDREDHNALTAHQERRRLEQEESSVADEAYRAVFLRVHPTGKMVLSLTTEADGNEGALRAARRRRARRARARRQGRAGRREPVRRRATGSTRARPPARRRRSPSATEKIRAKAQLLAGAALETPRTV